MPSLLPGFEYDIFISYRHNDNLDGWVTQFVEHLEKELRGTLKESLTIYFDKNPHDGLLESHNVDKSLEGKLKCLIFIPIISQTYCDPKSFAWQHEFVAFNTLTQEDALRRDIKLSSGNVASRILPIKIHELDAEDTITIEAETGGVLRAIEFIYKSGGVNRPMNAKDDEVRTPNQILYRDQVNKVANAIKEIITALKKPDHFKIPAAKAQQNFNQPKSSNKFLYAAVAALFVIVLGYLGYSYFFTSNQPVEEIEKSVAVLAFADMSPNKDQEWFSDGLSEEILNSLANLHELKVSARTSSFYFKGKDVSLQEIAQKLGVAHVVEGSVRKVDNQLRITAQLIRAKDGFHIWSQTYNRTSNDIFKVQTDIAESIAKTLLNQLSPENHAQLSTIMPTNVEAYEYFLRGNKIHHDKYYPSGHLTDFEEAEKYLLKSISLDATYAEAYGALADLYDTRSNFENKKRFWHLRDSVMQIGYQLNPNSILNLLGYGFSFAKRELPNFDSSFYYFKKVYKLAPDVARSNSGMGFFYQFIGLQELAQKFYSHALQIDPLDIVTLESLGATQRALGLFEDAKKTFEKIIELQDDERPHANLFMISIMQNNRQEAVRQLEIIKVMDPNYRSINLMQAVLYAHEGKKTEALKLIKNNRYVFSLLGMKKEFLASIDSISKFSSIISPMSLRTNPLYNFVRNEPEFKIISERVKQGYEEKLAKYGELE